MTPDTAALRAAATDALESAYSVAVSLHPATVLALCDAADEVERLRAWSLTLVSEVNAARAAHAALDADLRRYATTGIGVATLAALLDRERNANPSRYDAARTAHAALVADLRTARRLLDFAADNLTDSGDGTYTAVSESLAKVAALLDRHAGRAS